MPARPGATTIQRFVLIQQGKKGSHMPTFSEAMIDLRNPPKREHWIWYIFPQIDLTAFYPHASSMSRMYSIADMPELHAYVECKTLRANYIEGLDVMLELFNLKFESDLDPDASSLEVVPLAIEDGKEGGEKGMKNIEHYRLNQIFSSIDCVKFRSSLTLFEQCGVREIAVRCTKLIDHLGRPRDQKTEAQMKKTRHLVVQE